MVKYRLKTETFPKRKRDVYSDRSEVQVSVSYKSVWFGSLRAHDETTNRCPVDWDCRLKQYCKVRFGVVLCGEDDVIE